MVALGSALALGALWPRVGVSKRVEPASASSSDTRRAVWSGATLLERRLGLVRVGTHPQLDVHVLSADVAGGAQAALAALGDRPRG